MLHKSITINVLGDFCRFLALLCIINRITTVSEQMVLYKDFLLKHLNILSQEIFIVHWISGMNIFPFISFFIFFPFPIH
jgi:hypothetical protein